MTNDFSALLGYPAAFLTTIAFIPQAWQSWRTRDLSGISLPMYTLFTLGVALWLGYGLAIGSPPVIAANAVTLLLASVVLWLKIVAMRHIPVAHRKQPDSNE
ncbi:MAG: SemiSWEET transporter [Sideroxydans sp.]